MIISFTGFISVMKFCSILFVLFLVFSTSVSATNFYIGLNAGLMNQSGDFTVVDDRLNPSITPTIKDYSAPDDSSLTYSLFAGYKLGSDLALEFGFAENDQLTSVGRVIDLDQNPNSVLSADETSETSYYYAAFVGLWPVSSSWAFNARLGFAVWKLNYSQTILDTSLPADDPNVIVSEQSFSDNSSALLVGVGLSYGFSKNLEFKLTVENHFVDFAFTNLELDYDALSVTLGTAYHF
jgi:opacity protein-like surface antigen